MIRTYLTIASMLLLWAFIGRARAQEPVLPEKSFPRAVAGVGTTEESAKQDALKKAAAALRRLMQAQDPPMTAFKPAPEYVRDHLLTDSGRPGKEVREMIDGEEQVSKEWIVTFRTDGNWWRDIVRIDREMERKHRAEAHQAMTLRAVLGLAGLLLAGFGYVRLNEYTHRRYTTWLRVAGIGVATVVVAVLWWVFQTG